MRCALLSSKLCWEQGRYGYYYFYGMNLSAKFKSEIHERNVHHRKMSLARIAASSDILELKYPVCTLNILLLFFHTVTVLYGTYSTVVFSFSIYLPFSIYDKPLKSEG